MEKLITIAQEIGFEARALKKTLNLEVSTEEIIILLIEIRESLGQPVAPVELVVAELYR